MFISIVLVMALGAAIAIQAKINTTLSNRLNVTVIKGEKGESGKDGLNGIDGKDGLNGIDGKDAICTCNHEPEDREGLLVVIEHLIQIAPHIGDDPRIQEILKR
jgi:hypothetical protein